MTLGLIAVLAATASGCSSAAQTGTPTTATSDTGQPEASDPTTSGSSEPTSGGSGSGDFEASALTLEDLPGEFEKQDVTAQEALEQQTESAQSATVTPSDCATVSPITDGNVEDGYLVTFAVPATQQALTEFLAPAGSPTITELREQAERCASATLEVPERGVKVLATIEIVDVPAVTAQATLGLRSTIITTTAGSPEITIRQTAYLAEANNTLISLSAIGGPSGEPVDPALVGATFTTAVNKVNAGG